MMALTPSTCSCAPDAGGGPCADCMDAGRELIGKTIRDSYGREWLVHDVDSEGGRVQVSGAACWEYLDDVVAVVPIAGQLELQELQRAAAIDDPRGEADR